MRLLRIILPAVLFSLSFSVLAANAQNDDYVPEVTARVARISLLNGDVQIRHLNDNEWERAVGNLPLVEGDEIVTGANSRLEIQFDSYNHLRLAENARLKITTLRDEGIALSLPQGTLSLRVTDFDKKQSYFEIDAPQSTVAVEKIGLYRIDAGNRNDSEVRVTVADDGEARIYSETSGFTLRSGRTSILQTVGSYAGEWNTSDAARYADNFDGWVSERDAVIAKRLQNADYDKYYDRDFYGAEELNDYGEWVYTKKYGYVWKPYRSSISTYSDWSPYRYGHWRWISPFGWTWVNDESWGWATYHHGRWIYADNFWVWSPYAANRSRRSWWQPALVVVQYVNNYICWYPLPYDYGYYSYNYYDRRRYNTTIINNNTTTVIVNPTPNPTPNPNNGASLPVGTVPGTGVIAVPASQFGKDTKSIRNAPMQIAEQVLTQPPTAPIKQILPNVKQLDGQISSDIVVKNPRPTQIQAPIKTGATERINGASLDDSLRDERILGGRTPAIKSPNQQQIRQNDETNPPVRGTGAIKRLPPTQINNGGENPPENPPIRSTGGGKNNPRNPNDQTNAPNQTDEREPKTKPRRDDVNIPAPVRNPPQKPEPPVRAQPPPQKSEPPTRIQPPPQKPEPRQEAPRKPPEEQKPVPVVPEDNKVQKQKDG